VAWGNGSKPHTSIKSAERAPENPAPRFEPVCGTARTDASDLSSTRRRDVFPLFVAHRPRAHESLGPRGGCEGGAKAVTMATVEWTVTAEVIEWRGPAPYFFLPMSNEDSADFKIEAAGLEYWGQVGVVVMIGQTCFTTAVFPKDGRYLVPLRANIRKGENIEVGMPIAATVRLNHERKVRPDGPLRQRVGEQPLSARPQG
jgi:Domain of unknown function (DUF1905)